MFTDILNAVLGIKARVEETPFVFVIDLNKTTLQDGILRIPAKIDFPNA